MGDPANEVAISILEKILIAALGGAYVWIIWVTTHIFGIKSDAKSHDVSDAAKHEAFDKAIVDLDQKLGDFTGTLDERFKSVSEVIRESRKDQLTPEGVRKIVGEELDKRDRLLPMQIELAVQGAFLKYGNRGRGASSPSGSDSGVDDEGAHGGGGRLRS